MATFPTFESTLLHIANALGASKAIGSTKKKNMFKSNELSLENLLGTWKELLNRIFDTLELGERERGDLITNLQQDYDIHKHIELNVFTSKSSSQKVVWHYLSRVLIPALARHSVFWQIESKIDEGMPGGKFWYLPFLNPSEPNAQIEMPMQQTLVWLIDLIEKPNTEFIRELESQLKIFDGTGSIKKNLYNWIEAKSTPEISSIQNTFPDDLTIDFNGCLDLNDERCQFEQTLEFVRRKEQTPQTLQHQISIAEPSLQRIYSRNCSDELKQDFVIKVCERYQKPATKTIRQRLIIARAIQHGYEELVKFLTPDVDKYCTDLTKNKVMQLVRLYEMTYNLTLQAHIESRAINRKFEIEDIENRRFTSLLPPRFRHDILLSVTTEKYSTVELVAPKMNEVFTEPNKENEIQDVFLSSEVENQKLDNNWFEVNQKRSFFLKKLDSAHAQLVQSKAPYRLVTNINDYDLIFELAKFDYPSPKITPLLFRRLLELETNSLQKMKRIILELDMLLFKKKLDKSTNNKVAELLQLAYNNNEAGHWMPFILKFDAFHHIAQNKLKEAEKLLSKAVKECTVNSFGSMRGELASNAFALAVANSKLIPNNHSTYFKDVLLWGGMKETSDIRTMNIYDLSRLLHEKFWTNLYRHYPDYRPLFSDFESDVKSFSKDFTIAIKNRQPMKSILKRHEKLKVKQLRSPQSDSIVLLLLKVAYNFRSISTRHNSRFKGEDVGEIELLYKKQLSSLREVILEWPQIVDISDFKNQTPLMLAVHNNDYVTAKTLLDAGANPNLQDIRGRTALHSACASRTFECVELLVRNNIDEKLTTIEGATALHTAVRMGEIEIAKHLVRKFPHLLIVEELDYRTPLILAEEIANNESHYLALSRQLDTEQRRKVSRTVYKKQFQVLRELVGRYKNECHNESTML